MRSKKHLVRLLPPQFPPSPCLLHSANASTVAGRALLAVIVLGLLLTGASSPYMNRHATSSRRRQAAPRRKHVFLARKRFASIPFSPLAPPPSLCPPLKTILKTCIATPASSIQQLVDRLIFSGYSIRESVPQQIPDKPPFTAHLGNLSYDATTDTLNEFFEGCQVASVRIIEDREMQRPKGFGYVEFADVEGLKKALTLDGQSYQGRIIRIKVADPRMFSLSRPFLHLSSLVANTSPDGT